MTEIVIEKWTDEEKKLMMEVSKEVYDLLNKKLKNELMIVNCLDIFTKCYAQEIGLSRILRVTEEGKIIKEYVNRVLGIINGLQESDVNLVLFRNSPDVLLQYYMGLYFERPTFIIAEEKERTNIDRLMKSELIKRVEYVRNFGKQELVRAMDKMRGKMEKWNIGKNLLRTR